MVLGDGHVDVHFVRRRLDQLRRHRRAREEGRLRREIARVELAPV